MNKYEIMFIIKPDMPDEEKKSLFNQIGETVSKFEGKVSQAQVWAEKKKLYFTLKKHTSGLYYLMECLAPSQAVAKMSHAFRLNENILRFMFTRM